MAKFDSGFEGYPVRQTGQPTLAGHTTYHVNVIKIKRAIIWTGGLPQLRVTSPTWGPPHPCKQALSVLRGFEERRMFHGEWNLHDWTRNLRHLCVWITLDFVSFVILIDDLFLNSVFRHWSTGLWRQVRNYCFCWLNLRDLWIIKYS